MIRKDIDFRELLERVLPIEQLGPLDRLSVQRALESGVSRQLEAAALMALDRLEEGGSIRRVPGEVPESGRVVRYAPRDGLSMITLELPGPVVEDGIVAWPRASLPSRAAAGLDQVRRLVRLDDPGLVADPRSSDSRVQQLEQLDRAGRELLRALSVRFYDGEHPYEASEEAPVDPALVERARREPDNLFYCPNTAASARLAPLAVRRGVPALAVCAVPGSDGEPLGAIEVRAPADPAYGPDDLARVALLAEAFGVVLERTARVEQLVFVDALTGTYNRSYFELQARNEIARAQREGAPMALLIVDVDDFKAFNTAYGYEAGNQVLMQVAHTLRRGVRPFDTVARWGGEEFVVLLTAPVQADDVMTISERQRGAVQRLALRLEGLDGRLHRVSVTVSIGVALYPEHGATVSDLWRAANEALLEAKRLEKNRVVVSRGGTR